MQGAVRFLLTCIALGAVAATFGDVRDRLIATVSKAEGLSDHDAEALVTIARNTLPADESLPPDKRQHIVQDAQAYLERMRAVWTMSRGGTQHAAAVEDFAWRLRNVMLVPAATETDRTRGGQIPGLVERAIERIVGQAYSDTPPPLRRRIAAESVKRLRPELKKIGSYFWPQYLYVTRAPSAEEVVALLSTSTVLQGSEQRFSQAQETLRKVASHDGPPTQRQTDWYVEREAARVAGAVRERLAELFDAARFSEAWERPPANPFSRDRDPGALLGDESASEQMLGMTLARPELSDAESARLWQTVSDVLSGVATLEPDKARYLPWQLAEELDAKLASYTPGSDAEYIAVVNMELQWKLQNAVAASTISDDDRAQWRKAYVQVSDGLTECVRSAYVDTPPDVQDRIIEQARVKFAEVQARFGNYLGCEYVYPPRAIPSEDAIERLFRDDPFRETLRDAYARVAQVCADPGVSEQTKRMFVDGFVNSQAQWASLAAQGVLRKLQDHSRMSGYQSPSREYLERFAKYSQRKAQEARDAVQRAGQERSTDPGEDTRDGAGATPESDLTKGHKKDE